MKSKIFLLNTPLTRLLARLILLQQPSLVKYTEYSIGNCSLSKFDEFDRKIYSTFYTSVYVHIPVLL